MEQAKSVMYFILAGLCEIGGGYLVWLWLREHRSIWYDGPPSRSLPDVPGLQLNSFNKGFYVAVCDGLQVSFVVSPFKPKYF